MLSKWSYISVSRRVDTACLDTKKHRSRCAARFPRDREGRDVTVWRFFRQRASNSLYHQLSLDSNLLSFFRGLCENYAYWL